MRISIITATYNSAQTLRDTMESVLRQNYEDVEHIVVDGASKDNTISIVKEFEQRYLDKGAQLRWISEPDKGIYDAMNKGIAMTTGEIVGILNSDDFYTSDDVLATIADKFNADSELDAVYGDIHYVMPKDLGLCIRYYSSEKFTRKRMIMGFMPAHPSFYMKKSAYERFREEDGSYYDNSFKVAADFEFLLRVIYKGEIKTQYVDKDFVTMRTGGASTSGIKSHLRILADHKRAFKKNGVYSNKLIQACRYVLKLKEYLF